MEQRVAIIHYWLVSMRGGEKVLEELCKLYPDADIYTHVIDRSIVSSRILKHRIFTTFIDNLPFSSRLYKLYVVFMPIALARIDLSRYDLVISSEAGPAKGVITRPDTVHVCYCHSPMRYVWDQQWSYLRNAGALAQVFSFLAFGRLRYWDIMSSFMVDKFVANSEFVARRIKKIYRRDAVVINPPVDLARFSVLNNPSCDYYLCFGQLTAYKRIDIAVSVFTRLGRRLIVAGQGEARESLKSLAGPTVSFVGRVSDEESVRLLQNCRALVFPGEEDFGIVPIEAMACGRPVIAYGAGGASETVLDGVTGVLFSEQTELCLEEAVVRFEKSERDFAANVCRAHASCYDSSIFRDKMRSFIDEAIQEKKVQSLNPGRLARPIAHG